MNLYCSFIDRTQPVSPSFDSNYFRIPLSKENNFTYSSLKHQRGRWKHIFYSRSFTLDVAFRAAKIRQFYELTLLYLLDLPKTWKTLCFSLTIKVDKRSFRRYQNPVKNGIWHSCRLQLTELLKFSH